MEKQHLSAFDYDSYSLPSAATHIRLIELLPSSSATTSESADHRFSSHLSCHLTITPISEPKAYKAVSYTWGTPERTCSLNISGTNLPITPALDTALRHLRRRYEPIVLWVDQICIDQSNHAEKADQVLLMSDVYTKAEQVLIWLGPEADRSDELMNLWQEVGQRALDLGIQDYFTREHLPLLQDIMKDPKFDHPLTQGYHELVDLARPQFEHLLQATVNWNDRFWFRRVWTVQELCLCQDTVFVCGYKVVQVELVRLACNILSAAISQLVRSHPDSDAKFRELAYTALSQRARPLLSIRHRRQNFNKSLGEGDELLHLLQKLFVNSDTMATRNRDRIYGLLGLAVDAGRLAIKPDYASEDPSPIFTEVARKVIQNGRVELLSFSQIPRERDLEHLPSWVPDWRPNLEASYYTIYESGEDHLLAASGDTKVCLEPVHDPNLLAIRGYMVDTIEEVGERWHSSNSHALCQAHLSCIVDFCAKSTTKDEPIYDNNERRAEAVWRVPVGDLYWTKDTPNARAGRSLASDEYLDCLFILELLESWPNITPEERTARFPELEARRFPSGSYRGNMAAMDGKKPYLTRKGYVGMCPSHAAEGDQVVIFMGGRIPYVLRPIEGSEEFSFVGEAYCDGVMDGEILERAEERSILVR
ncbi:hypothetical protein MRS44_010318 [Fusarium solani]|uniref:Heterokaryon incompatibility protein n=1 Tax=Fusarium solani TaxID=169388 RepID=A0A9P9KM16_FUSSL|nr:heterokaryon incompatibility protein [Fusarium solani]KAH7258164.1 heterokaryon incompatibility protein [Fusarium solani]KAJ3461765.1 hypothetical protein MRS44_010318 [Fusarium solani]